MGPTAGFTSRIVGVSVWGALLPECHAAKRVMVYDKVWVDHIWISVGLISPFLSRNNAMRSQIRATWKVGQFDTIKIDFAIRSKNAPPRVARLLDEEDRLYDDVLRLPDVPWNESRLRGPCLSVVSYLNISRARYRNARYFVKLDDDVYLVVPRFVAMMRSIDEREYRYVQAGFLTFFSWDPDTHTPHQYRWSLPLAMVDPVRKANGPFPFAAGYMMIWSTNVVNDLFASSEFTRQVDLLKLAGANKRNRIMEDVWMGYMIYKCLASYHQLTLIQLNQNVMDLNRVVCFKKKLKNTSVVIHVPSKSFGCYNKIRDALPANSSTPITASCKGGGQTIDSAELRPFRCSYS